MFRWANSRLSAFICVQFSGNVNSRGTHYDSASLRCVPAYRPLMLIVEVMFQRSGAAAVSGWTTTLYTMSPCRFSP